MQVFKEWFSVVAHSKKAVKFPISALVGDPAAPAGPGDSGPGPVPLGDQKGSAEMKPPCHRSSTAQPRPGMGENPRGLRRIRAGWRRTGAQGSDRRESKPPRRAAARCTVGGGPFDHPARERRAGRGAGIRSGFPPSFGHVGEPCSLLLTRVIGNFRGLGRPVRALNSHICQ